MSGRGCLIQCIHWPIGLYLVLVKIRVSGDKKKNKTKKKMEKNQAACRHICILLSSALAESNVFFHKTSLTSPLFSEVPVPSQESVRPFIRCIDFKSVSVNFILKILELF